MERENRMPEQGETNPAITPSTGVSSTPEQLQKELNLPFTPDEEEAKMIADVRRKRTINEALEDEHLARVKEREKQRIEEEIRLAEEDPTGEEKRKRDMERAMRYGMSPTPKPGFKYEWVHSEQLGDKPVEWPRTREEAQKHIRTVLGRIELAQASPTQAMQIDYQNAQQVLESIEVREEDWWEDEKGNRIRKFEPQEIKEQKEWAKAMRDEIKARIQLHNAFLAYEGEGSIDAVKKAMLGLDAGWMNIVFGIEEKIEGIEEPFNPFVEALQYYEDNGHKFARHNSRELRGKFQKEVQAHLAEIVNKLAKENGVELKIKGSTYEWASNMAERMFRATGRAIMYDYLVVNKDDKSKEKMVGLDYEPLPGEKIDWAGGRDGCDYPMSKVYRFRENLKTSSESGLMRPHIELFDGVDIYAGDFWTRTINIARIETKENKDTLFSIRVKQQDYEAKVSEKIEELIKNENKSRVEAEGIARKLFIAVEETNLSDPWEKEYPLADVYSDRTTSDNEGERVRHIDFRRMARKVVKNEKDEEVLERGIDFEKMGDTPFSLWCSRMLGGPGGVLDKLTGNRETFALNPSFASLAKLTSEFDYSKSNAWKVKKQLLINYIKYARGEISKTGRRILTEEQILAGVNQLTGLTDENAPQFVQLPERIEILSDFFGLKISKDIEKKMESEAKKELESNSEYKISNEKGKEEMIKAAVNKAKNIKLTYMIDNRINRKFAASFGGWFLWGALKAGLKQFLAELGVK